jgi:demethylmenaquinone methyltransferase/2-methoxy-6-polyprenyl-1,4-benzoquinol methylase
METLFEMRWPGAAEELPAADRAEFTRLCSPQSPDFILNAPDYYMLFTYTLFRAARP